MTLKKEKKETPNYSTKNLFKNFDFENSTLEFIIFSIFIYFVFEPFHLYTSMYVVHVCFIYFLLYIYYILIIYYIVIILLYVFYKRINSSFKFLMDQHLNFMDQ